MHKIGVFDSGIGGFTILEELKKILPYESFIYYQDSKNNPYGEKSLEKLEQITSSIVEVLKKKGCKLIVIACNTATTKCMKYLRRKYPELIFVGTVPAIKVACDLGFKNTLVMATPATVKSERVSELIHDNKKSNQNIELISCHGLAHAIEEEDSKKIKELLHKYLAPYKIKNIDSIVLGCTHYPLIKNEILEEFGPVSLLDGSMGVAREVKRKLEKNGFLCQNRKQEIEIIKNE